MKPKMHSFRPGTYLGIFQILFKMQGEENRQSKENETTKCTKILTEIYKSIH